jgi:NTP pyrophosphatase (non-canonical NTP hydrolase)
MNFTEYQQAAARTMAPHTGIRTEDRHARLILALGLVGEAGEVADIIKKVEGHGHALDRAKLAEELMDLGWYLAAVATTYGISLDDAAQANIDKLTRRYPAGFSQAASRDRAVTQ